MARENPKTRKAQILAAAYNLATEKGLPAVSQTAVAKRMGVTRTLIINYFLIDDLMDAVINMAIERNNLSIMGSAIALGHSVNISDELKEAAIKSLV